MIHLDVTMKVHEGKREAFTEQIDQAIGIVKSKDTVVHRYDWYAAEGTNVFRLLESYDDSDAVLAHLGDLGDAMGALLGICDLTVQIFGNASPALREALAPFGAEVHQFVAGLDDTA